MAKILICYNKEKITPTGGPAGYLYNLKQGLDAIGDSSVSFLKGDESRSLKKSLFIKLPKQMKRFYQMLKRIIRIARMLDEDILVSKNKYSGFDVVHFHETFSLYENRRALEHFKGKIVVQSHSPIPFHLEFTSDKKGLEKRLYTSHYNAIEKADAYAFDRADYIIFPCPEAEEPYFSSWDLYTEIHKRNKAKYRYLFTGIADVKRDFFDIRDKHGISQKAFVISYVGRHNATKGYDIFKSIGEKVIYQYSNAYILVAGNEYPMSGLKHNRWIELGWTNDPYSVIAAGDVFILPNRETYFDIVMLEILSVGQIVIASKTGGNKVFSQFRDSGIFLYETENECLDYIKQIMNKSKNEIAELKKRNRAIFLKYFNNKLFTENYLNLINSLGTGSQNK